MSVQPIVCLRNHFHLLLACLMLAMGSLAALPAMATTTCTANSAALSINVGTVDGTTAVSASDNVTIRCNVSGLSIIALAPVYVTACIYVGGGEPWLMSNGTATLPYDLQTQTGTTLNGQTGTMPAGQVVKFTIPTSLLSSTASGSAQFTVYARTRVQQGITPGAYAQTVTNTAMDFVASEPGFIGGGQYPASCVSGNPITAAQRFMINVSANVPGTCSVSAGSILDFGSIPGLMTANQDQNASIGLNCTKNTGFSVTLGTGQNALGSTRRMKDSQANYVAYDIYTDPGRGESWSGSQSVTGVGTGSAQTIPVYGRIPMQEAVPGVYNDTVTITLMY